MRRLGLITAWSLVLVLTTSLTWQIVSAADDRVSDRPVSPLNVAAPTFAPASPTTTTTIPVVPTTSIADTVTPTTIPATTTTTSSGSVSSTTSTTQPEWSVRSISTVGGDVVVRYRPGEVVLQTATPAPGFNTEVDDAGPPEVAVEFESEEKKVEVSAKWLNGDLSVEVTESSHDD